jgi:hypothetical protein
MGNSPEIHGFVAVIGPDNNPNYFTGCGYSVHLNDAKVYRTPGGAMSATRIWQHADYNENPLPPSWYGERRTRPVALKRI